jgi:hypothetical protein
MKTHINTKTHQIHLAFIALSLLTLAFSLFALNNYLQAKNIEKNGKQVSGIVTEVFCMRKKKNNGTVTLQLPSEGISKKLKTNNCTFINIGDTMMVQFLSADDDILEYRNDKILTGRFFYSTLLGFVAATLIFIVGIKKKTTNNYT